MSPMIFFAVNTVRIDGPEDRSQILNIRSCLFKNHYVSELHSPIVYHPAFDSIRESFDEPRQRSIPRDA